MYLIKSCICGGTGPFLETVIAGVVIRKCECGVMHQGTNLTREEYEQQYRGDYHSAADRHPGCIPYRERYAHDRSIAFKRTQRYVMVLRLQLGRIRCALDVGCSTGAFVDVLRDFGIEAFGVDPDPAMASAYVCTGSVHDVEQQLANRRYDLITFHDVLEHLVDPIASLRAARALLAPGGTLIVDVPDVSTPAGHHHFKLEHLWFFTAASLTELASAAELARPAIDHPIPGKLVLAARRPAEEAQVAA